MYYVNRYNAIIKKLSKKLKEFMTEEEYNKFIFNMAYGILKEEDDEKNAKWIITFK